MGIATALCLAICLFFATLSASQQPLSNNRYKRLTAFGKSPTAGPVPTQGKGRECKGQEDCDVIAYTQCSLDPRDNKRRCICRDHTHPVNGQCVNRPRGLHQQCNADSECLEGAECKVNTNITTPGPKTKVCLCRFGFVEHDQICSGANLFSYPASVLLASLGSLYALRRAALSP